MTGQLPLWPAYLPDEDLAELIRAVAPAADRNTDPDLPPWLRQRDRLADLSKSARAELHRRRLVAACADPDLSGCA